MSGFYLQRILSNNYWWGKRDRRKNEITKVKRKIFEAIRFPGKNTKINSKVFLQCENGAQSQPGSSIYSGNDYWYFEEHDMTSNDGRELGQKTWTRWLSRSLTTICPPRVTASPSSPLNWPWPAPYEPKLHKDCPASEKICTRLFAPSATSTFPCKLNVFLSKIKSFRWKF